MARVCRFTRNLMRSPSRPPGVVGGVGEGDETLYIYLRWRRRWRLGQPFSPPPAALTRKTNGHGGGKGWPAVVEVRSIGQMMNDESENIRLTDHRVSLGHTV